MVRGKGGHLYDEDDLDYDEGDDWEDWEEEEVVPPPKVRHHFGEEDFGTDDLNRIADRTCERVSMPSCEPAHHASLLTMHSVVGHILQAHE